MHHILGVTCILLVSHIACLWAGKRWGAKYAADMKAEVTYLRARLNNRIATAVGATIPTGPNLGPDQKKVNPYNKTA
jgi:hypothetical protein